jgi:fused signal recognition particle receptor
VSIAVEHPTPIYYIGVGEGLDDLGEFDAKKYAQSLLGI